jgi:hypothetical protein
MLEAPKNSVEVSYTQGIIINKDGGRKIGKGKKKKNIKKSKVITEK